MNIRLYAGLAEPAFRSGNSGGLALWYLARAVDAKGSGLVTETNLKQAALALWSSDKYYRALRTAIRLKLFTPKRLARTGEKIIILASLVNVAKSFRVEYLGSKAVELDSEILRTNTDFRAACFAAFHAGRGKHIKNPISREVIKSRVGLHRRTQAKYETIQKVHKQRNYLELNLSKDHLRWAKDNVHYGCFIGPNQTVCRPLPNSYHSDHDTVARRTMRKANSRLRQVLNNADASKFQSPPSLFYKSDKAALSGMRHEVHNTNGLPSAFQTGGSKLVKTEGNEWHVF